MVLRNHFGIRLFTMSMRMCSLSSSVHGAHSRNTALNSTHCNSSQEFDDTSNILRTVALLAETATARRISHAHQRPIDVLAASMTRLSLRSTCTFRPLATGVPPATFAAPFDRRSRAGHGSPQANSDRPRTVKRGSCGLRARNRVNERFTSLTLECTGIGRHAAAAYRGAAACLIGRQGWACIA